MYIVATANINGSQKDDLDSIISSRINISGFKFNAYPIIKCYNKQITNIKTRTCTWSKLENIYYYEDVMKLQDRLSSNLPRHLFTNKNNKSHFVTIYDSLITIWL